MVCPFAGSCWFLHPAPVVPHLGLLTISIMILIVAVGIPAFICEKRARHYKHFNTKG